MKSQFRPGLREIELIERLNWFIGLRWVIFLFTLSATSFAWLVVGIDLPVVPVYVVTFFIAFYNLCFSLYLGRIKKTTLVVVDLPERAIRFGVVQTFFDLLSLFLLIHLLGGVENPFIFYFIFHTVLTSLFFPKRMSYLQACIVSLLMGCLIVGEYTGVIPHHHLHGLLTAELYRNPLYVSTVFIVFSTSIFFTTFITTSISERLRDRERELTVKTTELERANRALSEKDRLKSEYVRMVAHDIKSPLSSVSSLLDTVLEGYTGKLPHKAAELIERAQKRIEYLHHYTKDLLDLSKMRAKESLTLEPVDVKRLIDEAIALSEKKGKGVRLVVDVAGDTGSILADREQLLHVMVNLISNALKYTPEGGKVEVKAFRDGNNLVIRVSDTGIGIPEEDLPHIFDEFYRAGNVAKISKGTGLGLAMVKYIVERHGGSVKVESKLNQGSVFTVSLPLRTARPL